MQNYRAPFEGKKITVLGLGLLGRGVGDVAFLAQCGAEVLVTDKKTEDELASSVERLQGYPNITFRLGGHDEADFTSCDMVLKAAGVPLDSRYIEAARAAGVPVVMSTALFAKYAAGIGVVIAGITGTRGKSTVTHMVHHVLASTGRKVFLGGNIRGVSTLALLPEIESGNIAVLELDSWQLQGFGDLKISPRVAVVTNLMADHLNYYPDMESYFSDKANIFRYQKTGDALVVGRSIHELVTATKPPVSAVVPPDFDYGSQLKVIGAHNRENASLAAEALRALGISEIEIRQGLLSFAGVEGRLQFVKEENGVKIYNDNNATTPEASVAALAALATPETNKNIILIAGGSDKDLDIGHFTFEAQRVCKKILLLPGTGTERFSHIVLESTLVPDLATAVDEARKAAVPGDIILFSPGFASFGMFKNEYDRNDQFLKLVQ